MKLMVLDPVVSEDLIARRKELGIDRYDEVWEGVYVMPPLANLTHQDILGALHVICVEVIQTPGLGRVQPGANVSDRGADWEHNYRCPDVVVVLNGGQAVARDTHWQGGPDFLVEIRSPGDDTFQKLPFYESLGVREVLVVERDTREPTLYRYARKRLAPVKPTDLDGEPCLASGVVPLAFRKIEEKKGGPRLEVRRTGGRKKVWRV